jgi:hypothetical protein
LASRLRAIVKDRTGHNQYPNQGVRSKLSSSDVITKPSSHGIDQHGKAKETASDVNDLMIKMGADERQCVVLAVRISPGFLAV